MAINKVPSVNINISFVGAPVASTPGQNVLLIGHRNISNSSGSYLPLIPAQGYPLLTAYKQYAIPAQTSVQAYLSYMGNLGFAVAYGQSNTLLFSAPTTVVINVDTTVTLTWASAPLGYNLLVGSNIATTMTQATSTATGIVQSVSTSIYEIILSNVTGTFDTTHQIGVSTINNNTLVPDPTRTDEIVMQVYRYAQAQALTFPSPIVTSSPTLYISFLNNAVNGLGTGVSYTDVGYGPLGSSIPIVAPTTVSTLTNGNIALYWTTIPTQFGLVPSSALGATTITQTTSAATGVVVGYLNGLVPNGIGLEIAVTSGTFVVADALHMVLDITQTVFQLLTTPVNYIGTPYPITVAGDLTNSNYSPFFNFLTLGNAASSVNNKQFYVFGFVGNTTTSEPLAGTLPPFDPSTYGAQFINGAYTSYQPTLGDISFSAAELAAFATGLNGQNTIPFNPMNKITTPLPVSSNVNSSLKPTDAGIVLNLGWTPYVVDPVTLQLQVVRNVTGLLYYPSSSSPDDNDFPITNNQIIGLWKQSVYTLLAQPQFTNVRKSSVVSGSALAALKGLATQFEQLGMFIFTTINNPKFTITDNVLDPSAYDVYTPVVVSPELNAFNINTVVISYLNFVVTQA